MQRQLSRNVFSQSAKGNQQLVGPRSGTRHAAIRGRLGAHQKRRRGQLPRPVSRVPGRTGWYTRCDCAGSRFATCLRLNVRDSGKEIEVLNRMTLSLESEQNVGSRSEWQSQAGVVAGRSEGGQLGSGSMARPVFTTYTMGNGLVVCPAVGQRVPDATCASAKEGLQPAPRVVWTGTQQVPLSTDPTRQAQTAQRVAFVAPRRHANARLCVLTLDRSNEH